LQVVYPRMNVRWPVRNSGERIDWHRRNGTVKMIVIFVVVIADCRTTNSVNLKDNHHLLVFVLNFMIQIDDVLRYLITCLSSSLWYTQGPRMAMVLDSKLVQWENLFSAG
jgi:hypothetical protein